MPNQTISFVVSGLAARAIELALEKGKVIKIPSLGVAPQQEGEIIMPDKIQDEQRKMTITIEGVVTFSEAFQTRFALFNQAVQQYLMEAFPEFKPIHPPVTVTVGDVSHDDLILDPVRPAGDL